MAAVPDRAVLWVTFRTTDEALVYRYIRHDGEAKDTGKSEGLMPLTQWMGNEWAIVDVRFDTSREHGATVLLVERIVRS